MKNYGQGLVTMALALDVWVEARPKDKK